MVSDRIRVRKPFVVIGTLATAIAMGLYRHLASKDDLLVAVMELLIQPVRDAATDTARLPDPGAAFRATLAHSCGIHTDDAMLVARIAASSARCAARADQLIADVVAPAAARLRQAGRRRHGATDADLSMIVRMVEAAESAEQRATALAVVLDGLVRPP